MTKTIRLNISFEIKIISLDEREQTHKENAIAQQRKCNCAMNDHGANRTEFSKINFSTNSFDKNNDNNSFCSI